MSKPRYKHDCDACKWVGSIDYPAPHSDNTAPIRHADLYVCLQSIGGPSCIARFSSEGSDYASMAESLIRSAYLPRLASDDLPLMSTSGPALIASYFFAKAKGLI